MDNAIFPRAIVTITNPGNEKKLKDVFDRAGAPLSFSCHAQGTAPSAIMDIFGLSGRTRVITAAITVRPKVKEIFSELHGKLAFDEKGKGVAFSLPLTGLQSHIFEAIEDVNKEAQGEFKMSDKTYSLIFASVANGYSEDVFEAARKAGATGGTIIKGMREAADSISENLGIPLCDEQDFILIIVPKETKKDIMTAIMNECGTGTEAKGTIMSLPIEEVFGLR